MGEPVTDKINLLDTAKRRKKVLELRREGRSYRDIADRVEEHFGEDKLPKGWGPRYAHQDVDRELEKYRDDLRESAEKIVELEVQRIDELLVTYYPKAKHGHTDSAEFVVDLMERRAELLGLDEAEEYILGTSGGEDDGFSFGWADPAEAPSVKDFLGALRRQVERARKKMEGKQAEGSDPQHSRLREGRFEGINKALELAEQHFEQDESDQ